ncbi:MAG: DUF4131 domain-containing protein, partial [Shimia sp.]
MGGAILRTVEAGRARAKGALDRQRGHLLTWAPIALGLGIGLFFALKVEPSRAALWLCAAGALPALAVAWILRYGWGPIFAGLAIVALGVSLAGWRTHAVAGPVVEGRYYGPITGRVVGMDRSASDKVRLTLDRVDIDRRTVPRRVRVSLHGQGDLPIPPPGATAMLTGHLSAPPSPAEPTGFDFQRHAWFLGLGAVGYTRSPALVWEPPPGGAAQAVFRTRMALSAHVQAAIPGQPGALAAAVVTGDRSGI